MELLEVCESLVQETDGVRACVVLDLQTSLTLAQCLERGFGNADVLQATRIAGGIFRGKLLRQFVRTLPGDRGADGFVREAQVTTAGMHLFMASLAKFPNALLVCVTEKSVNIGMGWMAVHQALDHLREDPPELQAPGGQGAPPPVAKPDFPVTEPAPASSSQPAAAVRPVDSSRPEPSVGPEPAQKGPSLIRGPEVAASAIPTVTARAPAPVPPSSKAAAPKTSEPGDSAAGDAPAEETKPAEKPGVGKLSARGFFAPKSKRNN